MADTTRYECAFDCGWHFATAANPNPPLEDPGLPADTAPLKVIEAAVANAVTKVSATTDAAIRAHLDAEHPGWTMKELIARSQARLAASDPVELDDYGDGRCRHCGATASRDFGGPSPSELLAEPGMHDPGCRWAKAKEAAGAGG